MHARQLVLELLASSVDLSTAPGLAELLAEYGCRPERYGAPTDRDAGVARDHAIPGHHQPTLDDRAASVAQPIKIDNDLYVRDYGKCVLCYKCVEACGTDHQNTFAIAVAGRGFDARISTEFAVPLARVGVRLLRQLHRRLPDRRVDGRSASTTSASAARGTSPDRRRPTRSARTAAWAAR